MAKPLEEWRKVVCWISFCEKQTSHLDTCVGSEFSTMICVEPKNQFLLKAGFMRQSSNQTGENLYGNQESQKGAKKVEVLEF